MKKVLFVATVSGHIKAFHLPYLKMFKEKGYETYVSSKWTSGNNYKLPYCDNFIEIPIERSPFSKNNIDSIKQLKKIIEKEQFDIIHCHTPMGSVATRLAAKSARKKYHTRVIYTAHGFHFYKGAPKLNWILYYPIEKYLAKYTDTLITINKEDYNLAKNKFAKRCYDIQYVPGVGIDTKKFDFEMTKQEKLELRKSLGLKEKDFVMIYPARLDKNKNQIFLINCMEELVKENKNIHLLLPGNDELNGYYQRITKEKGLDKYIHFLGHRDDIPKLLKISNLSVSSSLREGLPVNILEAFACGLPVVVLKCRGMEDLIIDGENGFTIKSGNNIEKFCKYIIKLLNDKKLYNNISIKSKESFSKYNIEEIIKKYKSIYFN